MSNCRNRKGRFTSCATGGGARGRRADDYGYPRAETIQRYMGITKAQAKQIRDALVNTPGEEQEKLEAAGSAMEATGKTGLQVFGVEYIERRHSKYGAFYYTNTGDTYSPIIAYYPATRRFQVAGGWAQAAGLDY